MLRIQQGVTQTKSYIGQSQRTLNLLEAQSETVMDEQLIRVVSPDFLAKGFLPEVSITDLSFKYSQESQFELRIPKLEIAPNTHVAIVGSSGSGKTTLVDIILGILTPTHGAVEISGLRPLDTFKRWPGALATYRKTL